jgi:hypothetical protein
MAIKVSSSTVINNSLALENIEGCAGTFDNWHPIVSTITTDIDFTKTYQTLAMTSNVTFTTSNRGVGKQVTLLLDTGTTPSYEPTWPSEVKFPTAILWFSHRFWTVTLTCWDSSTVRATALPYDAAGTPSAGMDSSFLIAVNFSENIASSIGWPEAWAYVRFERDDANNRIIVVYDSGTSASPSTPGTTYINYTGLTGISSVQAQYNVQSQACSGTCTPSNYTWGPTPVSNGYNSGTYYNINNTPGTTRFGWMAQRDPNFPQGTTQTTTSFTSGNPDFRVKVVCNEGTFYSTAEVGPGGGMLSATYGTQQAV